ncbi:MAG: hypothetical protein COB39_03350 [Marinosulfonomonas sp.]|nr:MAG: hypothetical protein COB39_03350 [Marinosulfonomonas sp.]
MPHIEPKPERGIVAAACQIGGLTFSMPAPARHHDVLWSMQAAGIEKASEVQGFLDHRGVFVGRQAATIVALNWGQITKEQFDDTSELFSEHIW